MKFSFKVLILIIILTVVVATFFIIISVKDFSTGNQIKYGVTFSKSFSQYLELDWEEVYLKILDELKVKNIRIVVQWDEIGNEYNKFYFNNIDWMMDEAEKRNVKVILAIGKRVPRWPECHEPRWVDELEPEKAEQEQLRMVEEVVTRYRNRKNLYLWQVENEPFLDSFGECEPISPSFLKEEITKVRSLDPKHKILITDSGELSTWLKTAKLGDKFGHTLYREVYNKYIGYFNHIFSPAFYYYKGRFAGVEQENMIVAELQAEPWVPYGYTLQLDYEKMKDLMDAEKLLYNVRYAEKTGASEIYLWGAEWWWWLVEEKGDFELWNAGKKVFQD